MTQRPSSAGLVALEAKLARMEAGGQNPRGCTSAEYAITHEFGHCVQRRLDAVKYTRWWQHVDAREICSNAGDSPAEGFAEAFAASHHTPSEQRPMAVELFERLLREDWL